MHQLDFRPYHRTFRTPLHTSHGLWKVRSGWIIRLEDENQNVGFGECAPIPWFGTETFEVAGDLFARLKKSFASSSGAITDLIVDQCAHPAACFAIDSALTELPLTTTGNNSFSIAGLLPAGEAAVGKLKQLQQDGFNTFKWKMGVNSPSAEIRILKSHLLPLLLPGQHIRLDANGGLTATEAASWIDALNAINASSPYLIECLEQPLPAGEENQMRQLQNQSMIPIALDESLSAHAQSNLAFAEVWNWEGPLVIKPSLLGAASKWMPRIARRAADVILSSALETDIGASACLHLASNLKITRPLGFGTGGLFLDDMNSLPETAIIQQPVNPRAKARAIWEALA